MANIKGIMEKHGGNPDDYEYWSKYEGVPEDQFLASPMFANMTGKTPIGEYNPPPPAPATPDPTPVPLLDTSPAEAAPSTAVGVGGVTAAPSTAVGVGGVTPYMDLSASTGGNVGKPATDPSAYKPPEAYTPETVSENLTGLLAAESPYMQVAKLGGFQTAHKRGLLNSSIAAGAAQKAAIEAGYPIAAADAAAANEAKKMGYQGEITGALAEQGASHAQALAELQGYLSSGLSGQQALETLAANAYKAAIDSGLSAQEARQHMERIVRQAAIDSGLSAQEARQHMERIVRQGAIDSRLSTQQANEAIALEGVKQDGANYRLQLENSASADIAKMKLTSAETESVSGQVRTLGDAYARNVSLIQSDPNLSPEAKTTALANQKAIYENNMNLVTSMYGIELAWTPAEMELIPDPVADNEPATSEEITALGDRISDLEGLLARLERTGAVVNPGGPGEGEGGLGIDHGSAAGVSIGTDFGGMTSADVGLGQGGLEGSSSGPK